MRIFFFDVDGTIVDGPKGLVRLNERTSYALKRLRENNYVVICSGRSFSLMGSDIKECEPSGYILGNGGYALIGGKEVYHKCFEKEELIQINKYCVDHHGLCMMETQEDIFTCEKENDIFDSFYKKWNMPELKLTSRDIRPNDIVYKITTAFGNRADAKKFEHDFKGNYVCHPQIVEDSFDLTLMNVNKGTAVKEILDYLHIDKGNAYCFGDGENDVDMFKVVGNSIAMANASDYVKSQAKYVCDDVLNDGVYKWLKEHDFID